MTLRDGDPAENPFGFPVFVKPARLGSSVGITKAHDEDELAAAVELARRARRQGARRGVRLRDRGRVRRARQRATRSRRCRARSSSARRVVRLLGEVRRGRHGPGRPAAATSPRAGRARAASWRVRAYVATECEGMARADCFVRDDGEVLVNELNTIPGFTSTSVYAKLFEASGIPYARAARPAGRARARAARAALAARSTSRRETSGRFGGVRHRFSSSGSCAKSATIRPQRPYGRDRRVYRRRMPRPPRAFAAGIYHFAAHGSDDRHLFSRGRRAERVPRGSGQGRRAVRARPRQSTRCSATTTTRCFGSPTRASRRRFNTPHVVVATAQQAPRAKRAPLPGALLLDERSRATRISSASAATLRGTPSRRGSHRIRSRGGGPVRARRPGRAAPTRARPRAAAGRSRRRPRLAAPLPGLHRGRRRIALAARGHLVHRGLVAGELRDPEQVVAPLLALELELVCLG